MGADLARRQLGRSLHRLGGGGAEVLLRLQERGPRDLQLPLGLLRCGFGPGLLLLERQKLTTASAAWDGGYAWLAVVVFVNTVISLFYYLRWIVPAYRDPALASSGGDHRAPWPDHPTRRWSARLAVTAAALSLVVGLAAGLLWNVAAGI